MPRKVKIIRVDKYESSNPFMELIGIIGEEIYSLAKNRTSPKFYRNFTGGEIEIEFESGIRKNKFSKIEIYYSGKKVYPV